jgi:glucose/mannose-6-phosphate isomerase
MADYTEPRSFEQTFSAESRLDTFCNLSYTRLPASHECRQSDELSSEEWMPDLDVPGGWTALDSRGMLQRVADLPQQCEDAWKWVHQFEFPDECRQVQQVVVLGMGGSAIGADLLRTVAATECRIPILVHRDYGLPAFVDRHTLVIACSHSGNTEETLSGFDSAQQRRAKLIAVTTGGLLAKRARDGGVPLLQYQYESQPRAALGYSLIALMGILQALDVIGNKSKDVAEAVQVMRLWQKEINESVPTAQNAAKSLAARLLHHLPVVYGAEHLGEVARRWKGQLNENAKSWCAFDVLPELAHNTVAGYRFPAGLPHLAHVVMLIAESNHPRVRLGFEAIRDLLREYGLACDVVAARGRGLLAQALSMVHMGDYVSYYLAMLHGVDPWTIGAIDFIKARLGGSGQPQA